MADRPYHHGSLRTTLLAEAERTLRDHGLEALSLRDLRDPGQDLDLPFGPRTTRLPG